MSDYFFWPLFLTSMNTPVVMGWKPVGNSKITDSPDSLLIFIHQMSSDRTQQHPPAGRLLAPDFTCFAWVTWFTWLTCYRVMALSRRMLFCTWFVCFTWITWFTQFTWFTLFTWFNCIQLSSDGTQQALSRRMLDKLVSELESRFHHYQVTSIKAKYLCF